MSPGAEPGADISLQVWLKATAPGVEFEGPTFPRKPPERPFDFEVGGDGDMHPSFWARCPHLEHLQALYDPGEWWSVRLWLAEPFRRPDVGAYATPIPFRTDDFARGVRDAVESLVEDFGAEAGLVDYLRLAKATERERVRPGAPPDADDPEHWRAVVSELYRRHGASLNPASGA
jgi:hypothetical protein